MSSARRGLGVSRASMKGRPRADGEAPCAGHLRPSGSLDEGPPARGRRADTVRSYRRRSASASMKGRPRADGEGGEALPLQQVVAASMKGRPRADGEHRGTAPLPLHRAQASMKGRPRADGEWVPISHPLTCDGDEPSEDYSRPAHNRDPAECQSAAAEVLTCTNGARTVPSIVRGRPGFADRVRGPVDPGW